MTRAVEDLLYGGEELVTEGGVGDARVAVTSHRVLVLSPGEGANLRAVHRPNVTGVEVATAGPERAGLRALRAAVYAVPLIAAGLFLDLEGLISPVDPPAGIGLGGLIGMLNAAIGALALVDDALLLAGVVALLVALAFLARYVAGRERYLEIGVAGGDPIRVAGGTEAAAERLADALGTGSSDSTG